MRKFIIVSAFAFMPFLAISQLFTAIDEIAPYSEGLAAIRKGNQWGFIDRQGNLAVDFRDDLVWSENADNTRQDISGIRYPIFKNGRCPIQKTEDDITVYGFIDTNGKVVIEAEFLNVAPFEDGYTTGVIFEKVFKGDNEFKLKIFKYKFHEVVMDTSGKIVEYLSPRDNILMSPRRYERPWLRTKLLSKDLISIRNEDDQLEIHKLSL